MGRRPRRDVDPVEREIERALQPRVFIGDRACSWFVRDLDALAARIATLTRSDPARAVKLHEIFIGGCYEKAEELDDSSGSFGQTVGELFCRWVESRQAAGADPEDTVTRLLTWVDDDPYGFCNDLPKDVARVLDKTGLVAFERRIRARFEAAGKARPDPAGSHVGNPDYARRRWGDVLRRVYLAQKDTAAYLALAEETGITAEDCLGLATLLAGRRKAEEALAWVERGIEIDRKTPHGSLYGLELAELQRKLLTRLGRGGEALQAAWADYRRHPCKFTYDDLMKFVPRSEVAAWHEKALDAATGTDLHSLVELLLETKEIERLADLVRRRRDPALEELSHHVTEPAANKLEKSHPDLAARLWRAQGMRIVNAKKSKYYDAALSNFERAKHCYEKAGLSAEWEKTVNLVRVEHRRKTGFLAGFERVVAGSGPSQEPSFLERAKARWGAPRGGPDATTRTR